MTHRELLQNVWGPDYGDEVDYLRVVINQLRKKIEGQPGKASVSVDRTLGRLPPRAAFRIAELTAHRKQTVSGT